MDKPTLNKQIVLCRRIVKQAKVNVIRKNLKKIKILRKCKIESLKEKKLRKADRLLEEIQKIKVIQADKVLKFGLITEDISKLSKNTNCNAEEQAYAKLIEQKTLRNKINAIREKFKDWKKELPILLETEDKDSQKLKKNKPSEKSKTTGLNKLEKKENNSSPNKTCKSLKLEKRVNNKWEITSSLSEDENENSSENLNKKVKKNKINFSTNTREHPRKEESSEEQSLSDDSHEEESDRSNNEEPGKFVRVNKTSHYEGEEEEDDDNDDNENNHSDSDSKNNNDEEMDLKLGKNLNATVEKIDDPFFINKKVIPPKLLREEENESRWNPRQGGVNEMFSTKPFKLRTNSDFKNRNFSYQQSSNRLKTTDLQSSWSGKQKTEAQTNDELHPSWAAKKIQKVIKPFEGKKITFTDD